MTELRQKLSRLKDVADRLPARLVAVTPPAALACEVCGGQFGELEFGWHWTGVIHVRDLLCPNCARKHQKDACQLACLTCKVIASRLQKMVDQSGFVFEAGKFYHTLGCYRCLPVHPGQPARVEIFELEQHKLKIYGQKHPH